jgi:hypothetical protein
MRYSLPVAFELQESRRPRSNPEHAGRWPIHPWRSTTGNKPKPTGGIGGGGVREPRADVAWRGD